MLDKVNWRTFVNEKLTGRKVNRWAVNLLCAAVSLAIAIACFRWAFGNPFPPIPGEGLIIAALPYAQSMWDNFVRSNETRTSMHTTFPQVNPHGGPDAP